MKDVRVRKAELVHAVTTNREAHRGEFEKALAGYFKTAGEALDALHARLLKGERVAVQLYMSVPEDHTRDYDQVLAMLEMSVDDEVTIDYKSFRQFVLDDWEWKEQWRASNSSYTSREE